MGQASFDTTICVLEGLLQHEWTTGRTAESVAARRRGQDYLLRRRLFRRLSTGDVIEEAWLSFSFPPWWHYDVLRALDYFRAAADEPDPRLGEAIDLVRSKRHTDGKWLLENMHQGAIHFAMDDSDGEPSRWNTLRALRVLNWYEQPCLAPAASPSPSGSRSERPTHNKPPSEADTAGDSSLATP